MKCAYTNGILLDGTEQMQPVAHKILLTEDDKIIAIADEGVNLDGYEVIDLHGSYIMPGLVNLHTHAAMTLLRGLADDLPLISDKIRLDKKRHA